MKYAVAPVLALVLLLPSIARAELVPESGSATDGSLAVAPDGSPRIGYLADGRLMVASRALAGTWTAEQAAALPGSSALIDAVAAGSGSVFVLVQDTGGRWLALEERTTAGWRAHLLVRSVRHNASLGLAGLALDRSGRPVVAYALRLPTKKTFLRVVRPDAAGRYLTVAVTKAGFPPSQTVPSAAPVVLASGDVRVVETYEQAAIEWSPQGRTWVGQLLYASALGAAAGPVAALAGSGGVYSAWTELFAGFNESQVLLVLHRDGEETAILHRHAFLVGLVLGPDGPEAAANDYVDGADLGAPGGIDYAGVLVGRSGILVELDGRVVGYAADASGGRQILLRGGDGLQWYRTTAVPSVQVRLTASLLPGGVALSGSLAGAAGGHVELYREQPGRPRTLVATVAVGGDGSFSATDTLPPARALYRAVYEDAAGGLPYASLLRLPIG
ncbi:MAG: hypothetical protein ABR569_04795 [Gaiellaceae bacterium]